ncbi:MAG: sulfotransferase [Roseivirga sp.]|nr:sulfotransferase [Roseivirga sp.]
MRFFSRLNRFAKSIHPNSIRRVWQLTDGPIIICGCPRSGTTLLLAILAAHPEIQGIQAETRVFKRWSYSSRMLNRWYHNLLIFCHLIKFPIKKTARRWAEKTPQNVQYIEEILNEFKTSVKIIHIVRDGRDVITSRHPTQPDRFFVSPEQWAEIVSKGLRWIDHPQVLTIQYENLVQAYDTTVNEVMSFLGLNVSEEIAEYHKYTTIKAPKTLNDEIQPISNRSIGKWTREEYKDRTATFNTCKEAVEILKKISGLRANVRSTL